MSKTSAKPHARGLDGFLKVGRRGVFFQNQNEKRTRKRRLRGRTASDRRRGSSDAAATPDYAERASTLLTVRACQRATVSRSDTASV
jgi:hypothetical protein